MNAQTWVITITGLMSAVSLAITGWRMYATERDKADLSRWQAKQDADESGDDVQRLLREELRRDVDRLRNEIDLLRIEVDQARERGNLLQRKVYELEQENRELKREIRDLKEIPHDRRRTDPS